MKLGPPKGGTALPALVAALVLLGVTVALAARPQPGSQAGPSPRQRPAESLAPQPRESPSRPAGPVRSGGPAAVPSTAAAACERALAGGDAALEGERGLTRAMRRVSENCVENPQAAGLLRALERLERERSTREPSPPAPKDREDRGRYVGPREGKGSASSPRAVGPAETGHAGPAASPG